MTGIFLVKYRLILVCRYKLILKAGIIQEKYQIHLGCRCEVIPEAGI
jgi:hypothetical protein